MKDRLLAPVAAIDCGTNSTRLLVVGSGGVELARLMRITRLGRGVDSSGDLDPDSIRRTIEVLEEYRRTLDFYRVEKARLVATSAVRDATSGREFLEEASQVCGFEAELLDGEEEGRLAFLGATSDLAPCDSYDVVADIGGGSTEIAVGGNGDLDVVSLEVGCVRLTERYFKHDPPKDSEIHDAVDAVRSELDRAVASVPRLETLPDSSRLIGLAGTVSTLATMDQGLITYEREMVHHSVLSSRDVRRWCETLASESSSARAMETGMPRGREDVIVGGAVILRELMERFRFQSCLVSESDILDGLVISQHPVPS